jgi:hypothetical protein
MRTLDTPEMPKVRKEGPRKYRREIDIYHMFSWEIDKWM